MRIERWVRELAERVVDTSPALRNASMLAECVQLAVNEQRAKRKGNGRITWLTPYVDIYKAMMNEDEPDMGVLSRSAKRVEAAAIKACNGDEDEGRAWAHRSFGLYMREMGTDEKAPFVSFPKWASQWRTWLRRGAVRM